MARSRSMRLFPTVRRGAYGVGRGLGNLNAWTKALQQGSPEPLLKRLVNRWIGRNVVSKMWWR